MSADAHSILLVMWRTFAEQGLVCILVRTAIPVCVFNDAIGVARGQLVLAPVVVAEAFVADHDVLEVVRLGLVVAAARAAARRSVSAWSFATRLSLERSIGIPGWSLLVARSIPLDIGPSSIGGSRRLSAVG